MPNWKFRLLHASEDHSIQAVATSPDIAETRCYFRYDPAAEVIHVTLALDDPEAHIDSRFSLRPGTAIADMSFEELKQQRSGVLRLAGDTAELITPHHPVADQHNTSEHPL